jgi:hypothetical protein
MVFFFLQFFGDFGDKVVLVKKSSLKGLTKFDSKDMNRVTRVCWYENGLFHILGPADFRRCSSTEIKLFNYATINIAGDTMWSTLVDFIFGVNGVKAEYVFLDALCINRSSNKHVDKRTVMERRSQIFEHSKEHHIIELSCLYYCETWYDLSFIDQRLRPILHNCADDPEADQKLLELFKAKGFGCVDTSELGEVDMKEFVEKSIVHRWKQMEKMIKRVQDTVINAMELSKVTRIMLCILS